MALASIKNLGRLADVAVVLARHGFADLVDRLELPHRPGQAAKSGGESLARRYSVWARVRMVAEELGPTFVKLGQILSMRPDLLPKELVLELRNLQDHVSPEPFGVVAQAVEKALGRPLEEVYDQFDETPLASASLAQVHRARRADDGREVAVKVRRPGIQKVIHSDLELLKSLASSLNQRVEALRAYNLPGLVAEIASNLQNELDFSREADHMALARAHQKKGEAAVIPEPHPDLTRPGLLTMELIHGQRIEEAGLTPQEQKRLAHDLARLVLEQVLGHGFFHADPHPGNILVARDADGAPCLALVDWGLVGRLTSEMRFLLGDMVLAVVDRDAPALVRALVAMGAAERGQETDLFVRDVEELVDQVHSRPLSQLNTAQVLLDMMELMRTHHLRVQVQYALLDKALLEMEWLARTLDPDFDPIAVAAPYVRRLWMERWRPDVLLRQFRTHLVDGIRLFRDLPGRLDGVLRLVERGELGVEFKHKGLVPLISAINEASSRITVGLIVAALIVGSSMIITTGVEPKVFGLPLLGLVGYVISGVVGLWLVWSILRGRRGRL